MEELHGKVIPTAIEDEIKESYLNYAMSVIVSRALPDVRDGLKPVHRRILYSMHEMGLRSDRAYKKCGRIVGDVLGKYHPHGDQSIYDALVRLAQFFSMRYPVVNPQGNFGSVDGDPPAAMRYTEAKMARIAEEMLKDIQKETVDYGPNYDDTLQEPLVLPGAFPYLLANGASGIAVGMATNMPPHNLIEIGGAINAYIDNPDCTIDELMEHVKGPDFPTQGIIFGKRGIRDAFHTGKGKVTVRARCSLEETNKGRERIIVSELPYAINKATLIIRIADLVKNGKIGGIADLRDESDKQGTRIVIELKRGAVAKIVLNQLFSHTSLQANFNVNNLALVDGRPKLLNLKDMIHYFVRHRVDVVTRRTKHDLRKAEEREHILEGLKIALDNIEEVIQTIRSSKDVDTARHQLMTKFDLSERQSQAILEMRLQKLTNLETQKIVDELEEVRRLIAYLKDLLSSEAKILGVVREETNALVEKYGDERKTEIIPDEVERIDIEDLIKKENMAVLISNRGYIKRIPVSSYRNQGRGGKGSSSANLRDEDFIEHLFIASTHDYILFISSEGKAYWLKVHEIPEGSKATRGSHIKALLAISANEDITAVVALEEFSEERFIFMATRKGTVKKVKTSDFANAKTRGIIALKLEQGDNLVSAILTCGKDTVLLASRNGHLLRYDENEVRPMGRSSRGVRGMRLSEGDEIVGVLWVEEEGKIFLITENGFGKRVDYDQFTPHGRGTRGQIAYKTDVKTGEVIGVLSIKESDEVVGITSRGNTIKFTAESVPIQGKTARGVTLVNIQKPDQLVGVARVIKDEDKEEG
ncbi:MAG: DNA topoisomerase (ATP-hydrolyzing) subunit A [Sediminispirochaetaceae bacterium]